MTIQLDDAQKADAVIKLKQYFDQEMGQDIRQDIGQFEAEFLLDFFAKEVGAYFYNQGLRDAGTLFEDKIADVQQHLYELEKIV